jgi:dTDP-glucose 4,6-dehydratase
MPTILITGASGFIGSALIRYLYSSRGLQQYGGPTIKALVHDTEARNLRRLSEGPVRLGMERNSIQIVNGDLVHGASGLCEGVDFVIHCAAKTFVDHAILDPAIFVQTNVVGTLNLLEDARRYKVKRFIFVSTDETLGSIAEGAYAEDAPTRPTNVYSASKAGGEALAMAYAKTYGLHTIITRTENNFGFWQNPQKVFPTFVKKLLAKEKLPVYGDGKHVRQWLWVEDHCRALMLFLFADVPPGDVFHVAGNQELTNTDLALKIIRAYLREEGIGGHGRPDHELMEMHVGFIPDHDIRPGHDRRYALNCDKLRAATGWSPEVGLDDGIRRAVSWYVSNEWWLR